jgi:hypothetical protein
MNDVEDPQEFMGRVAPLMAPHLQSGMNLSVELALLSVQSPINQRAFDQRLRAVVDYLEGPSTSKDADRCAATIGVARQQFYRLVEKMKRIGPVRGLTPGFQNVRRRSSVRSGLGDIVEKVLAAILREDPYAGTARVERLLRERLPPDAKPPSQSSLRRRLKILRSAGSRISDAHVFGEHLLVDQSAINLPLYSEKKSAPYAIATLIIDKATKLIVGVAVSSDALYGMDLSAALSSVPGHFLPGLKKRPFAVSDSLKRVDWVIPPHTEDLVPFVTDAAAQLGIELEVQQSGVRRHGSLLTKELGDRLGPYFFLPRYTEELARSENFNSIVDVGKAEDILFTMADQHNEHLIGVFHRYQGDQEEQSARMDRVGLSMARLFAPLATEFSRRVEADEL